MKKITSVKLEIQIQSDELDAKSDATRRALQIKTTAAHLVESKLHQQAPPAIAAILELFNMAEIQVQISSIELKQVADPYAN